MYLHKFPVWRMQAAISDIGKGHEWGPFNDDIL
jgi:hypothetical protein